MLFAVSFVASSVDDAVVVLVVVVPSMPFRSSTPELFVRTFCCRRRCIATCVVPFLTPTELFSVTAPVAFWGGAVVVVDLEGNEDDTFVLIADAEEVV